jgi:hypothetical protein
MAFRVPNLEFHCPQPTADSPLVPAKPSASHSPIDPIPEEA